MTTEYMNEPRFVLRVPWGVFDLQGGWQPNRFLNKTVDEQYAENVGNGFIKPVLPIDLVELEQQLRLRCL